MANAPSLSRGQVHSRASGPSSSPAACGVRGGKPAGWGRRPFTGFALYLGADGAFIALFTSAAYFLALTQLLAPLLSARVRDKKRFVVFGGYVEIVFRGLPLIIPLFVPEQYRLPALGGPWSASACSAAMQFRPFTSTWIANAVPENIRARFASRQDHRQHHSSYDCRFRNRPIPRPFPPTEAALSGSLPPGRSLDSWGTLILLRAPFPQQTTRQRRTKHALARPCAAPSTTPTSAAPLSFLACGPLALD